jgi:hypothetical protein
VVSALPKFQPLFLQCPQTVISDSSQAPANGRELSGARQTKAADFAGLRFIKSFWRKIMRHCRIVLVLAGLACLITSPGWAQTANEKYIDMMRKDLRKEKQAIVDRSMGLDAAKKSQFWAIYADYEKALDTIWDQRIANITKYADNVDKITDEIADQLSAKMMDLEGQRSALRNKYYKLYKEKMGSRIAARFLQVEYSLASLIDLQLETEIPLLQ